MTSVRLVNQTFVAKIVVNRGVLNMEGIEGTDSTAIHDDTASEIDALDEKGSPANADIIIIEDSADSNNKKKVQIGNLPTGTGMSNFTLTGDSGTPQTVTEGNTVDIEGGTGIDTVVGATDKVTVSLSDEAYTTADHDKLDAIEAGAEVNNISDANATDLTDSGDSALHYHASDRNRANHTGTQAASTISDFDTEVANNSAVAANTAKNSYPTADSNKLAAIEAGADVTDGTNVNAAGATMNSDSDVSGNSWVLDEDNMTSDDNTKVPTQQSVKAYVDAQSGGTDSDAIHDNVSGEIVLVTEKGSPASADVIIIEDSADSNNKKRVQIGNLPTGSGMSNFTLDGDSGTPQTVTDGNTVTLAGGDGIQTVVGATDTVTINVPAAAIDDTMIDWGTGAGQVSAVDLPIADAGAIITATDVEAALQENRTAIDLNTTHTSSNGSDHSYIDQDVTSGSSPTLDGANITGVDADNVDIADAGGLITATDVEGALQENRTAIDLNTAKETNANHTGDVTGSGALTIASGAVDIAHLSATGTPGASNFLRGDNQWATPAGGGNVSTSGTPVDNDFAKFVNGTDIEGRSYAEVRTDLGLVIGTDVLAEQTIGIADDNLLEVDGSPNDNEYARFTANGLEGRTTSEMITDLALDHDDDLTGIDAAGSGVTYGHINTSQQDLHGDKDFQDEISVGERSKAGINSISYSTTISVDFSAGDLHVVGSVTGNLTINTSNVENGQTGVIVLPIDSTGGYTIATGTGTWQDYDDTPYVVADCDTASTTYHIYYMILSSTIYYSIQAVSP